MSKYLLIICTLLFMACKEEPTTPNDLLDQMNVVYSQIEELIETSCESGDQCIATALGVKPCGGLTQFIIHSSDTDQEKLDALIDQYNELNKEYNETSGVGSDCAVVTAPEIDCISGNCKAVMD